MSRGIIILIVVLCGVLAALLALPKLKNSSGGSAPAVGTAAVSPAPQPPAHPETTQAVSSVSNRAALPPRVAAVNTQATAVPVPTPAHIVTVAPPTPAADDSGDPPQKPLPVLERSYATTTNRDERLDVMMDIAEQPSAEAVKTLTRLFSAETDTDLKVDLLDSLLGIEGFKDEKMIMLTLGIQAGLPAEVRQSAIDGLIDLEDTRAISLLNGLKNDPDPEIRQAAEDAIELIQTPPEQLPKLIGK